MKYLRIHSIDPAYNLALEEQLFLEMEPDQPGWFLIWQNGPSVIVGRHQNTVEEVNGKFVKEMELPVVRRSTGGGAVFHDLGNVNFSCIVPVKTGEDTGFGRFLKPVVAALHDVGVKAEFSSRNDITVDGKKFSGSAQRRNGNVMLHHGTLMYNLDMSMLGRVLAGNPDKYQSKGVASHRSRVVNLKEVLPVEVTVEKLMDALRQRCSDGEGKVSKETQARAEALAESKYRSWAWNYGQSPRFGSKERARFPWGAVELCLNVEQGRISTCRIQGDFFAMRDVEELEKTLLGLEHKPETVRAALEKTPLDQYFLGCDPAVMLDFLSKT